MQHLQKTGGGGHCYPRALRASRRGVPLLISHPSAQYPPCFAERVLNVPTLQPANLQTFGFLRGDLSPIPPLTDQCSLTCPDRVGVLIPLHSFDFKLSTFNSASKWASSISATRYYAAI